jgi:hypothetical protein
MELYGQFHAMSAFPPWKVLSVLIVIGGQWWKTEMSLQILEIEPNINQWPITYLSPC